MIVALLIAAAIMSVTVFLRASEFSGTRAGRWLLFFALLVLPSVIVTGSLTRSLHKATGRNFCLSCHEMEPYGKSLFIDDEEVVPAAHFQNHRVPPGTACYVCHKDYAMFGDIKTKLNGMRHLYAHYIGGIPDTIKLYRPYSNNNCLSCHGGARNFIESEHHNSDEHPLSEITGGRLSCMAMGCHDVGHSVHNLDDYEFWAQEKTNVSSEEE
jgi:cytochrome c-type protein NapC